MELSLHFSAKQSNSAAAPPVHMQIVRSGAQNLSCDKVLQRGHFLMAARVPSWLGHQSVNVFRP